MNNQDAEHLRLLSIFHYVCAGMIALFSCFPIIHLIIGLVMVLHPRGFGPPHSQPPALFGFLFIFIALFIIAFGWITAALLAWAGHNLGQRKNYTFCLVMAGIACLFMPFGTVLGVFSIIVLSRPSVKAMFEPPRQPPVVA